PEATGAPPALNQPHRAWAPPTPPYHGPSWSGSRGPSDEPARKRESSGACPAPSSSRKDRARLNLGRLGSGVKPRARLMVMVHGTQNSRQRRTTVGGPIVVWSAARRPAAAESRAEISASTTLTTWFARTTPRRF